MNVNNKKSNYTHHKNTFYGGTAVLALTKVQNNTLYVYEFLPQPQVPEKLKYAP